MILFENQKKKKKKLKSKSVKFFNLRCGGVFALQALENGILRLDQLEAMRRSLVKHTDRKVRIILLLKPIINVTAKPVGVRMGKGKGDITEKVVKVVPGQFIVEIVCNIKEVDVFGALQKAKVKLPILTQIYKEKLIV